MSYTPTMSLEIELKFRVEDPAVLEARLRDIGFQQITPSTFESNTLYDTPDRSLRERGHLLRLREYGGRWTLTHKEHPPVEEDTRYKRRIETETTLADGDALAHIFLSLGLQPVFRYEKWRSEWAHSTGHLVLDQTPIGIYAELEGDPAWIDESLQKLGIDPETCTTDSYGKLFQKWRDRTNSPIEHLTFGEILPQFAS
jgi:adenylate cyclase class 2